MGIYPSCSFAGSHQVCRCPHRAIDGTCYKDAKEVCYMEKLNVKVGDKVLIDNGNMMDCDEIDEVTKITPTGIIRLKGRPDKQFAPDGREKRTYTKWAIRHQRIKRVATEEDLKNIETSKNVDAIKMFFDHHPKRDLLRWLSRDEIAEVAIIARRGEQARRNEELAKGAK